jgi:hypothetical protein
MSRDSEFVILSGLLFAVPDSYAKVHLFLVAMLMYLKMKTRLADVRGSGFSGVKHGIVHD